VARVNTSPIQHGLTYQNDGISQLARMIESVFGNSIESDETGKLVIGIGQAGVTNGQDLTPSTRTPYKTQNRIPGMCWLPYGAVARGPRRLSKQVEKRLRLTASESFKFESEIDGMRRQLTPKKVVDRQSTVPQTL
jgi:hypothetical protein